RKLLPSYRVGEFPICTDMGRGTPSWGSPLLSSFSSVSSKRTISGLRPSTRANPNRGKRFAAPRKREQRLWTDDVLVLAGPEVAASLGERACRASASATSFKDVALAWSVDMSRVRAYSPISRLTVSTDRWSPYFQAQ